MNFSPWILFIQIYCLSRLTVWTVSVHRFKTSWICRFPRISYNVCKCLFLSFIFVFSFANLLHVTESIVDLASQIENSSDATIAISELTFGRDGFNRAVKKASKHLKELLPSDWMETYPAPKDRREWFGQGTIKVLISKVIKTFLKT